LTQGSADWPRPQLTVDLVVLSLWDDDLKLLLIRRGEPPFAGSWALPGGFVRIAEDEGIDDAAHRELAEETGLPRGAAPLRQLHTFGEPGRDPRGRVISVAYWALVRPDLAPLVTAGTDAAAVEWRSLTELPPLAFDHADMVAFALARIRAGIQTTDLAFALVPPAFTARDLRAVFEVVQGAPIDPGNFRRRLRRMQEDGVITEAPGRRRTGARPARLYRFVSDS